MSFKSTAEGRVGVDGADRWRKTVSHVGTADRESPSSKLGPSSLYRGCSGMLIKIVATSIVVLFGVLRYWSTVRRT